MVDAVEVIQIGDWDLSKKMLAAAPATLDAAIKQAVAQEAEFFVGKIKKYMRSGSFAPLSPLTVAVAGGKSGGKPLFRSGDLRNAVTKVMDGTSAFIGIPRSAPGKAGKPMVNIAAVHEGGATIVMRMTEKMRRFLHARLPKQIGPKTAKGGFYSKSTGIIVIKIPARPFIAPVMAEYGPGTQERFVARLAVALNHLGMPAVPLSAGGTPPTDAAMPSIRVPSSEVGGLGGLGSTPTDRSAAARRGWATRRSNAGKR